MRDRFHVQPARRDVRGDQDADGPVAETVQRGLPLALGPVAVQAGGLEAGLFQLPRHLFGAVPGAREYQNRPGSRFFKESEQQVCFQMMRHREQGVADRVRRLCQADGDAFGMPQIFGRQSLHLFRECRGEQQGLALPGKTAQDAPHRRQESHVEHAVRLIQNKGLDAVESRVALIHEVEQAAGAGHQHLDAFLHGLDLRALAHAAVHGRGADLRSRREHRECLMDLFRQLPCRRENERGRAAAPGLEQTLENGQDECGGLAGAGLGRADAVMPCQNRGNGLLLNRGRHGVAGAYHGRENARIQIEFFETHSSSFSEDKPPPSGPFR